MVTYLNFLESELDIPLCRIITVDRLFELLVSKKNTLVSPSLWEDPFESFTSKAKIKLDETIIIYNPRTWGQCWTTRINETDAMWRIYTPSKNGVKIKTTARKLMDSFLISSEVSKLIKEADENEKDRNKFNDAYFVPGIYTDIFLGKVKYLSIKRIIDPIHLREMFSENANNILFVKRLEFKHENEFRIILDYFHSDFMNMDLHEQVFHYTFNFNEIIDEIVFDPRMDKNLFSAYQSYIKSLGFKGKVKQSRLYSLPKYNFDL